MEGPLIEVLCWRKYNIGITYKANIQQVGGFAGARQQGRTLVRMYDRWWSGRRHQVVERVTKDSIQLVKQPLKIIVVARGHMLSCVDLFYFRKNESFSALLDT